MWLQINDDVGRCLTLREPPRRIVSLVPSVTELVCDLGRGNRLVGVTRYCTDPPDIVGALPKLGGTKDPDLHRIRDLSPELVIVNAEENRREDFQALTDAGLTLWVSFPRTVAEAARSIERLGRAIDAVEPAAAMAADIRSAQSGTSTGRVRVFCPIWRKPWMSLNRDTYAHDVLSRGGGNNVCADRPERYPVVELADIALADPEVVLLPSEPYPFGEHHRSTLGALDGTSALRTGRVHLVDGRALSWYGNRTAAAIATLRHLLAVA